MDTLLTLGKTNKTIENPNNRFYDNRQIMFCSRF